MARCLRTGREESSKACSCRVCRAENELASKFCVYAHGCRSKEQFLEAVRHEVEVFSIVGVLVVVRSFGDGRLPILCLVPNSAPIRYDAKSDRMVLGGSRFDPSDWVSISRPMPGDEGDGLDGRPLAKIDVGWVEAKLRKALNVDRPTLRADDETQKYALDFKERFFRRDEADRFWVSDDEKVWREVTDEAVAILKERNKGSR